MRARLFCYNSFQHIRHINPIWIPTILPGIKPLGCEWGMLLTAPPDDALSERDKTHTGESYLTFYKERSCGRFVLDSDRVFSSIVQLSILDGESVNFSVHFHYDVLRRLDFFSVFLPLGGYVILRHLAGEGHGATFLTCFLGKRDLELNRGLWWMRDKYNRCK